MTFGNYIVCATTIYFQRFHPKQRCNAHVTITPHAPFPWVTPGILYPSFCVLEFDLFKLLYVNKMPSIYSTVLIRCHTPSLQPLDYRPLNLMQEACGHPLQPVVFPMEDLLCAHYLLSAWKTCKPTIPFLHLLLKKARLLQVVPRSQAAASQEFTKVIQIPCCYAIPPALPRKRYPSASLFVSKRCPLHPCWGLKPSSLSDLHSKLQAGRNTSLSMVYALSPEAAQ